MTTRLLPVDEWPRLAGTLLETVWPNLDPTADAVLVVEDAGQIVACSALVRAWHLEGTWVAPQWRRRVTVGRRLLTAMRALLRGRGVRDVLMMALNDRNAKLCARFGPSLELTCRHFLVTVR